MYVGTYVSRRYEFDRVFDYEASQDVVYTELSPMVVACLRGQGSSCMLFVGSSQAGKSRTMSWLSDENIFPLSQVVQIDADLFKTGSWIGPPSRIVLAYRLQCL